MEVSDSFSKKMNLRNSLTWQAITVVITAEKVSILTSVLHTRRVFLADRQTDKHIIVYIGEKKVPASGGPDEGGCNTLTKILGGEAFFGWTHLV
jgi:hypothetical protein